MKPYLKYIFEVAAIVVGITLSLLADEWREDRQNRKETTRVLYQIQEDLKLDTASLGLITRYTKYYSEIYDKKIQTKIYDFSADSIIRLFVFSVNYEPISLQITGFETYNNLKNPIIENKVITTLISQYYSNNDLRQSRTRMIDLVLKYQHSKSDLIENRYMEIFWSLKRTNLESEFYIDRYSFMLRDSSDVLLEEYEKYVENVKSLMETSQYKNHIYEKRLLEMNMAYYAQIKYNLALELLKDIDEELNLD